MMSEPSASAAVHRGPAEDAEALETNAVRPTIDLDRWLGRFAGGSFGTTSALPSGRIVAEVLTPTAIPEVLAGVAGGTLGGKPALRILPSDTDRGGAVRVQGSWNCPVDVAP